MCWDMCWWIRSRPYVRSDKPGSCTQTYSIWLSLMKGLACLLTLSGWVECTIFKAYLVMAKGGQGCAMSRSFMLWWYFCQCGNSQWCINLWPDILFIAFSHPVLDWMATGNKSYSWTAFETLWCHEGVCMSLRDKTLRQDMTLVSKKFLSTILSL